jgi:hypothetical protein
MKRPLQRLRSIQRIARGPLPNGIIPLDAADEGRKSNSVSSKTGANGASWPVRISMMVAVEGVIAGLSQVGGEAQRSAAEEGARSARPDNSYLYEPGSVLHLLNSAPRCSLVFRFLAATAPLQ